MHLHQTKNGSKPFSLLLTLLLALSMLSGCSSPEPESSQQSQSQAAQAQQEGKQTSNQQAGQQAQAEGPEAEESSSLGDIPAYSGSPYAEVCGNEPQFTEAERSRSSFEEYSELDSLGRCGVAFALIGTDTMPTEERGRIGEVKPSGWHTVRYNGVVEGNYLYNRCHLIGYQLAGENANPKNLITGTRYLNTKGMLPFEDEVADYVKGTGNHVLYRVAPIFEGNNLVASGVHMEALSVEDGGEGISFNVYCYNVQPKVSIDYATGDSSLTEETGQESANQPKEQSYVLNTSTKKFHEPGCSAVGKMRESNKQAYTGSRDDLIAKGYSPCGKCNP